MTHAQLESVHDELVSIIDSINDASAREDRGRANNFLVLTLADDGSGTIGKRRPDGNTVEDWHDFRDFDELVKVLKDEMGTEFEREPK